MVNLQPHQLILKQQKRLNDLIDGTIVEQTRYKQDIILYFSNQYSVDSAFHGPSAPKIISIPFVTNIPLIVLSLSFWSFSPKVFI